MSQKFETYIIDYIKNRMGTFKKYMLAALGNKDGSIMYLVYSEGMVMPNSDLKNCELLRDAQLFREDTRVSRNGRNTYKIFYLTEAGRKIAEDLKAESLISEEDEKLLNPITYLAE